MATPKLSIVTISYNQGKYLESTIKSVIAQRYENLEYIIVDGGSSDNSLDIIKKYEKHIDKWLSEPDNGAADALNKGFELATGDWIYYLNSDDYLADDILNSVIGSFDDGVDIYYGNGYAYDQVTKRVRKLYSDKWSLNLFINDRQLIFQQSTFIRSIFYKKYLRFNVNNTTCWDGELLVDAALKGARFKRFEKHVAYFRLHEESITVGSGRNDAYLVDRERIEKKVFPSARVQNKTSKLCRRVYIVLRDPVIHINRLIEFFKGL